MTEQDYRTKLKALQILHHMSMDLTPEANVRYDRHGPTFAEVGNEVTCVCSSRPALVWRKMNIYTIICPAACKSGRVSLGGVDAGCGTSS